MLAKACGGIDLEVYKSTSSGREIEQENHPLATLLNRPNPMQSRSSFMESAISYYLMTGNTFIDCVAPSEKSPPMELWTNRPDKMKIIVGSNGYPKEYQFVTSDAKKVWPVNPVTFKSGILHLKSFSPNDDWFGLSPLEAAMLSLQQNNEGGRWNLALLQNAASPSGVFKVTANDANPAGTLEDEKFNRLRETIQESYQGSRNSGRPFLLEGGLEWQSIAYTPMEMSFLEAKKTTGVDICSVFGVPPEMVGLGQKTFNNYKEARLSFYEDTVLPLMDFFMGEMNYSIASRYGEGTVIKYDKDDIEALVEKREAKYTSLAGANWLTQNEKREASGHEPKPGWDVFIIGNQAVETPDQLVSSSGFQNTQENPPPPAEENPEDAEEPPEDLEETDLEDQELEAASDYRDLSIKQVNLLNQKEKQSAWKKMNRKRDSYIASFSRDIREDLLEMSEKLREAGQGKPPKLAEYAMLKELSDFMPTLEKTIQRHIKYVVDGFGKDFFAQYKSVGAIETKSQKKWEFWAKEYIKTRSGNAVGQIEGSSTKKVREVVKKLTEQAVIDGNSDYDFAKDLEEHFDGLSKSRARLIARTETGMASNSATLEAAKALDIPTLQKEWVSVQDDRTRDGEPAGEPNHLDMNGTRVPINEKFTVEPDYSMEGPGDPSGGAENVCNCRCVLVFSARGE